MIREAHCNSMCLEYYRSVIRIGKSLLLVTLLIILPAKASGARSIKWQTFDSGGVPIAYFVTGTGEPVLLIHGLSSSADINWVKPGIVKALADRYRVVALDLRGHGRSGKPKDKNAYGLKMVDDCIRLIDTLRVERAHIVGYSLGGIISMKLISENPERVLSGTLGGMGWLREGSRLQKIWEMLGGNEKSRTPSACVQSIGDLAVTESAVRKIQAPVAIIVGERDPVKKLYVTPLTHVRRDWPVTVIEGAGHLNCIARPQFSKELRKWLDENAGK